MSKQIVFLECRVGLIVVIGVAYTVSKHGLIGLTRHTAAYYRNKGIRCNAIQCGAMATNISTRLANGCHLEGMALAQAHGKSGLHLALCKRGILLTTPSSPRRDGRPVDRYQKGGITCLFPLLARG